MAKSLFVGNLSYGTSEAALRDAFAPYGASQVRIIEGRGFGFVDVEEDQVAAAIENMNEVVLDGRKIFVNEAKPKEPRQGGYGGGGGRGGRGGRDGGRGGDW